MQILTNRRKNLVMLKIEIEREDDGRWIAEIPALPGALVYGATMIEAQHNIQALALRMIANRIENGELSPIEMNRLFVSP